MITKITLLAQKILLLKIVIQSVINGSFKAINLGGNETDLYLDANLNSLDADIIPQDIIPKEYKLELSAGCF